MDTKNYFFLGIGGIGNSALALYFKAQGYLVSGYDKTASPITDKLCQADIPIQFEMDSDLLPDWVSSLSTQVVVSAAIGEDQTLFNYFRNHNYTIEKRAQTLAKIANAKICVAVAGTHGKTSTLSYLTHIFATAQVSFSAFIGGVLRGYETNFVSQGSDYILVEADEYDRSFLHLHPDYAAITNMDPDHLDIYYNTKAFREAFQTFAQQVKNPVIKGSTMSLEGEELGQQPELTYSYSQPKVEGVGYRVDLHLNGTTHNSIYVSAIGSHNLENALTAAALADQVGLPHSSIIKALENFEGIHRRMAVTQLSHELFMIDDYAHHPTEIEAVFSSLEERFPKAHKTIIFQPHLYSRTRDFMSAFATVLSRFDKVYLMPIYPAREAAIPGITSEVLLAKIGHNDKAIISAEAVLDCISKINKGIVVILGAGDIGLLPQKIKKMIV